MTAQEAKFRADNVNKKRLSEQHIRLMEKVTEAVDNGLYQLNFTEILTEETKEYFLKKGFEVKIGLLPYDSSIYWKQ